MQVGKQRAKKHNDGRGLVSTGGMATEPQYPRELGPFSLWSRFHCQATFACAKPIEPQVLPMVPKRKALDSARNAGAANTHCLQHFDHKHKSWELRNHSEPQLGGRELINQRNISYKKKFGFLPSSPGVKRGGRIHGHRYRVLSAQNSWVGSRAHSSL